MQAFAKLRSSTHITALGRRQIMVIYNRNRAASKTLTFFGSPENAFFEQLLDNLPASALAFSGTVSISSRGDAEMGSTLTGLAGQTIKNQ